MCSSVENMVNTVDGANDGGLFLVFFILRIEKRIVDCLIASQKYSDNWDEERRRAKGATEAFSGIEYSSRDDHREEIEFTKKIGNSRQNTSIYSVSA